MSIHIKYLINYLKFRKEFLEEEQVKNNGNLQCVYCGREHLEIGSSEFEDCEKNNKIENLATVDHIIPRLPKNKRLNKDICVVACKKCNKLKTDIDPKIIKCPEFGNMNIDTFKKEYFNNVDYQVVINTIDKKDIIKTRVQRDKKVERVARPIIEFYNICTSQNINIDFIKEIIKNEQKYFLYSKNKNFYFSSNKKFTKNDCEFRLSIYWSTFNTKDDLLYGDMVLCKNNNGLYETVINNKDLELSNTNRTDIVKFINSIPDIKTKNLNRMLLMTNIHNHCINNNCFVKMPDGKTFKLLKFGSSSMIYTDDIEKYKIKWVHFEKIENDLVIFDSNNTIIKHML